MPAYGFRIISRRIQEDSSFHPTAPWTGRSRTGSRCVHASECWHQNARDTTMLSSHDYKIQDSYSIWRLRTITRSEVKRPLRKFPVPPSAGLTRWKSETIKRQRFFEPLLGSRFGSARCAPSGFIARGGSMGVPMTEVRCATILVA